MFDFSELEGLGAVKEIEEEKVSISVKLGAYVVWSVDEYGNLKTIKRVFRNDPCGILFFGCSWKKDLNYRIRKFCKSISNGRVHSEGKRYHRLKYSENGYPSNLIRIGWKICGNARECEKNWLDKYEKEFGELPPLNYQSGKKNS